MKSTRSSLSVMFSLFLITAAYTTQTLATVTIGQTAVLSAADNGNGGLIAAQNATLSQSATVQSLSFYVTAAAGTLVLGIYDASGPNGGPGVRLAQTSKFSAVAGWNTHNVTTPVALAAGNYWLAYLPSSNDLAFVKQSNSGACVYAPQTAGPMPSTYPTTAASCTPATWSFYATLTPAGGANAVNGQCGSANGVAVGSLNTSHLCAAGTASSVTGSGPWMWSCDGSNGGTTEQCSAPLAAASSISIGDTAVESSADNGNGGLMPAQSASLPQSATIQSLSFYVTTAAGQLALGIYDSTGPGGGPGALRAQTDAFTPVTGWNTASVVTPVSLAAGNYWLAYLPSSNNLAFVKQNNSGAGACVYVPQPFGAMPSTYPAAPASCAPTTWSLYATLTASGSDSGSYNISGTVSGAIASGVTVALAGASTASTTTNQSGNYTLSGLSNGSYAVTPSLTGYTFTPESHPVTVSGANVTAQNFTATAATNACTNPVFSTNEATGTDNLDSSGFWWVNNDAWSGSHGPQTIYVCSASSWYVVSNQQDVQGQVETYPDTEYDIGGRDNGLPTKTIAEYASITSTFSEAFPSAGSWDAAYDLWLNNWGTEIMIWNEWTGTQLFWPPAGAQALTLNGVPYHFYNNGGEFMFFRDTMVKSGSVDILAALNWLVSQGLVKSTDVPTQLEYGVEICSTSGAETFPLTGLTFSVQ